MFHRPWMKTDIRTKNKPVNILSALDWNYSRYSSRASQGPAVLTLQTCLHKYFTLNNRKAQKQYSLLELLQETKIFSSLQSIYNQHTWRIKTVHNIFFSAKYHSFWMCDISDSPNKTHLILKWPWVSPTIQKRLKVQNIIFHLSVIKY